MVASNVIHNTCAALSATSFILALYTGVYLHYTKVVNTHIGGYPTEWWPSISAVIGDHFPERSIFQYGMALTAVFRFVSVYMYYRENINAPHAKAIFTLDVLKTLGIGGFTYITSTDAMVFHSVCMGVYALSSASSMLLKGKNRVLLVWYMTNLGCMGWWLQRHHTYNEPGAYSVYAVFEWMLPLIDILFDWSSTLSHSYIMVKREDLFTELPYLWNALVFWTNVTMLPMTLWYFPLWNMGLSGYEASLLAYTAPLLLTSRRVRDCLRNRQNLLSFVSALGITLGNQQVLSPQNRLCVVAMGTVASMLFWTNAIVNSKKQAISYLLTGLVMSNGIKYLNDSINPLWNTVHKSGTTMGLLCIIHTYAALTTTEPAKCEAVPRNQKTERRNLLMSVGVGTTLFVLHTYLTDSGTLMLWTPWESSLGGFTVITQMLIGLLWTPPVLLHIPLYIFGALPLMQMTIARTLLENISIMVDSPLHMGASLFVYLFLLLADVWTVAYAFVPLGNLLRERSGLVFCTALGLQFFAFVQLWKKGAYQHTSFTMKTTTSVLFGALILSTCVQQHIRNNQTTLVNIKDTNVLTVGIWTVHFGMDDHMFSSHRNMTDLIRKLDLDVVGLLESDTMRNIGGNRNMMLYLARSLNMHYIYGATPRQNTWGCSLLSKYPIVRYQVHLLPSPVGELACAVEATILTRTGKHIDVIVSHNGQEEDFEDRLLQTERLAHILKHSENPVVFAGYLVTKPGEEHPVYRLMVQDGNMKDILPADKFRWCEYIFYRDLLPLGYARIAHGKVTDTELQTAKFWIGEQTDFIQMDDRNMYPKDLLGVGVNGHRYHVYTGPIYDPLNYHM